MRSRRTVLHALGMGGMTLPGWRGPVLPAVNVANATATAPQSVACAAPASTERVVRRFADPLLELTRLLRLAAETEHATVLQYLYAAFSLRADYAAIGVYDSSGTTMNLLEIAIDRMTHFHTVNRVLVSLGAPPHLRSPLLPLMTEVFPFTLALQPAGRMALAQFLYREAPFEAFDAAGPDATDRQLMTDVCAMLGIMDRPRVRLYAAIAAVASEATHAAIADMPDLTRWIVPLRLLDTRGEGRFEFLKSVFQSSHPAFDGHRDAWQLRVTDPHYPAYDVARGDAACAAWPSHSGTPSADDLLRLGDLQYTTTLLLLDLYFRQHLPVYRSLAVSHMIGPVQSIGRHLPRLGLGMPFRAAGVPDTSALDVRHRLRFVMAVLQEAQALTEALQSLLPPNYPMSVNRETMTSLRETSARIEAR